MIVTYSQHSQPDIANIEGTIESLKKPHGRAQTTRILTHRVYPSHTAQARRKALVAMFCVGQVLKSTEQSPLDAPPQIAFALTQNGFVPTHGTELRPHKTRMRLSQPLSFVEGVAHTTSTAGMGRLTRPDALVQLTAHDGAKKGQ